MIGIVVADVAELTRLKLPSTFRLVKQFRVYDLVIDEHEVALLVSGIGPVNAAAGTQALITARKVTKLYNFGSAGGYAGQLKVGALVLPRKIYFHDVHTPWHPRGVMPGEAPFYTNEVPAPIAVAYANVNLASGSSFFTNLVDAQALATEWNVHLYDMEAAAIAQVAKQNNLPLCVVKSVSDLLGEDKKFTLEVINERLALSGAKAWDLVSKMIGLYER